MTEAKPMTAQPAPAERLTREVSPAEQFLRTLPAAKAGQSIEEAAAEEIRRLREENEQLRDHSAWNVGFEEGWSKATKRRTAELAALAERERVMREALELFRRTKSKIGGLSYDGLPHEDIRNDLDQADAMAAVALSPPPAAKGTRHEQ